MPVNGLRKISYNWHLKMSCMDSQKRGCTLSADYIAPDKHYQEIFKKPKCNIYICVLHGQENGVNREKMNAITKKGVSGFQANFFPFSASWQNRWSRNHTFSQQKSITLYGECHLIILVWQLAMLDGWVFLRAAEHFCTVINDAAQSLSMQERNIYEYSHQKFGRILQLS